MGKTVPAIITFLVLLAVLSVSLHVFGEMGGFDVSEMDSPVAPRAVLTPDMDSEKLLYDDVFMEEAIMTYTLRSLTTSLSRLGYQKGVNCHDRAHELGRRAYELLGGDSFKNCGIECHSGCRHGATEAFFAKNGTADLIGSMEILCGDAAGSLFHLHQCVHGVGHGLMAWYDYDLPKALKACDLLTHISHKESCYSGVFMENIVGSIARSEDGSVSGHHTDYLSDDPHYPCNVVDDPYKRMCYWLQTDHMLNLFGDVDAIGVACAEADSDLQFSCFYSMGRTISAHLSWHPMRIRGVCVNIAHSSGKEWCLEGALSDLMWDISHADRAIEFCALSSGSSFEKICYDRLIVRGAEVSLDGAMPTFCSLLPEQYHDQCIRQQAPKPPPLSVSDVYPEVAVAKTESPTIRYVDGQYVPDVVHISVGDRVVWVNEDAEQLFWPASNIHPTHAAYPGSDIKKCDSSEREIIFDACAALPHGAEYSFAFHRVGQWRFHDHVNPRATGVVIVSEK